jgi:hypothetical protein
MRIESSVYITLALCLINLPKAYSQVTDQAEPLSNRTAFTVPKGSFEFGLFQYMRFGVSDKVELAAHPILIFLDPQLRVKIRLKGVNGYLLSSEHGFTLPTPLLRTFQMSGAGGLISTQYNIPAMVSFYNGLILSKMLGHSSVATAKAGITFVIGSGSLEESSSIDFPLIYPRLLPFYHQPVFDLGLDFRSEVMTSFFYLITTEAFIAPGTNENFFFEHRGNIGWKPGPKFMLQVGYRLCFGKYPYGPEWHLLPDFDLAFRLNPKKKSG